MTGMSPRSGIDSFAKNEVMSDGTLEPRSGSPTNCAKPVPNMVSVRPQTTWFARRLTVRNPKISAPPAPANAAASKATAGL